MAEHNNAASTTHVNHDHIFQSKNSGSSNSGSSESKDIGINSKKYHFHSTIQEIEDGIYQQFLEQNKNLNKDRETAISSISDAMYRKLYTAMFLPVLSNILIVFAIYFFVPILLSIKSYSSVFNALGIFLFIFLFCNILFDGYVVYRIRKFVIEKVTKRYFQVVKTSWRGFEGLFILLSIFFMCSSLYFEFFNNFENMEIKIKLLQKIVNSIDLNILMYVNIILVPLTVIIYYIFVRFVNNKAMKEQKISIIDSRKGSEHNAEVAESILDGSYLEIDMNDL